MVFEQIHTAGDRNFGYLIANPSRRLAMVVDPSGAPGKFIRRLEDLEFSLKWIIATHHHHDHTNGTAELCNRFPARLAVHRLSPLPSGVRLEHNQELELGSIKVRILHTPGHTEDSICIYIPGAVLTGDTLFVGKVGGTDFGEGARRQYESLHRVLLMLPDETKIYPGHDVGVRPASTIGEEKKQNPFLLQTDFEHFVNLKRNWQTYKAEHGIQ